MSDLKIREIKNTSERLLISSLPGKALRMLVDIVRLAERFNMCCKAEPGKFDIKRRKPGILFISLQAVSLFNLVIMMQLLIFM